MSATNPEEESTNPEPKLTPAEVDSLGQLEAIAQRGLETYLEVGNALAEIRDRNLYRASHPSFETYVSERWGVNVASDDPLSLATIRADARATSAAHRDQPAALPQKPCEALAEACEQTLSALDGDERLGIEIRVDVRKPGDGPAGLELSDDGGPVGEELILTLRWLLAQATATVGDVAHELEIHAVDVDDEAREQLRDDVLGLDGELAVVKTLLFELIDWDSELKRLLKDELPPLDTDTDPEVDD